MALIDCPECARQVSNIAQACPNCGYPIDKSHNTKTLVAQLSDTSIGEVLSDKIGACSNDSAINVATNELGVYSIQSISVYSVFAGSIGSVIGFLLAVVFMVYSAAKHYETSPPASSISYSIGLFVILAPMWVAQNKVAERSKEFKYKMICGLVYILSFILSFFIFAFMVFK